MAEHVAHTWRKASQSGGQGACVEIAVFYDGTIGVRDSKNPTTNLTVTPATWTTFLANAKHGVFDL